MGKRGVMMSFGNVNKDVIRDLADKHGRDFDRLNVGASQLYEGNIDDAVRLIKPEAVVESGDDLYFVVGGDDVLYRTFDMTPEFKFAWLELPVYVRSDNAHVLNGNYELHEVPFDQSNTDVAHDLGDTNARIFFSMFFVAFLLEKGSNIKRMLDVATVLPGEDRIEYVREVFENEF